MASLDSLIAFVARETGYPLEYITSMPIEDFWVLVKELQEMRYRENMRLELLLLQILMILGGKDINPISILNTLPDILPMDKTIETRRPLEELMDEAGIKKEEKDATKTE